MRQNGGGNRPAIGDAMVVSVMRARRRRGRARSVAESANGARPEVVRRSPARGCWWDGRASFARSEKLGHVRFVVGEDQPTFGRFDVDLYPDPEAALLEQRPDRRRNGTVSPLG
jgi:hypothetical protein